jgi:bifunctional DNA-binding transcriptional regulator/antitoxin component of YhaV-PrlF toxin-antitoxin module
MPVVKTSSKGQIVIPLEIRKKLGIRPGQKVDEDPINALRGILKGKPSLTKALLSERKKGRERKEKLTGR